jgi:hypothetical protein
VNQLYQSNQVYKDQNRSRKRCSKDQSQLQDDFLRGICRSVQPLTIFPEIEANVACQPARSTKIIIIQRLDLLHVTTRSFGNWYLELLFELFSKLPDRINPLLLRDLLELSCKLEYADNLSVTTSLNCGNSLVGVWVNSRHLTHRWLIVCLRYITSPRPGVLYPRRNDL